MSATLIENKKVFLDYEITERFDAGVELLGFEVKSLKGKLGSLEGSYVTVRGGEAFLINAFIPPYQEKNTPKGYDPRRNRKLLLTKKELAQLADVDAKKGLTIAAISMYNGKEGKIKLSLGVARGKKKFDKRQDLRKRDATREMRRTLKGE
jgi:SsrA-binding protein